MRVCHVIVFCIISSLSFGQTTDTVIWGQRVSDPFWYLENESDPRTIRWLKEQEEIVKKYSKLDSYTINGKDVNYWNNKAYSIGAPIKSRNKYFEIINGRAFMSEDIHSYVTPVSSYETIGDGRWISPDDFSVSLDLKYTAIVFNCDDSIDNEIRISVNKNSVLLDDHLIHVHGHQMGWYQDGFYYTRNEDMYASGFKKNLDPIQKIYYHKVRTPQSEDKQIFFRKAFPDNELIVHTSYDEKYLFFSDYNKSTETTSIFYQVLGDSGDQSIHYAIHKTVNQIGDVAVCNGLLYAVMRPGESPNGHLEILNLQMPDSGWHTIIPALSDSRIENVLVLKNKIVVKYLQAKRYAICVYDLDGRMLHLLEIPEGFQCSDLTAAYIDSTILFRSFSYTLPPVIYRFDLSTYKTEVVYEAHVNYDVDQYITEPTTCKSMDNIDIPITLIYKKGIVRNGNSPLILEVGEGFNSLPKIAYSPGIIGFLDAGGIYVNANIRGNRREHIDWHKAGMGTNKQKTVDDLTAVVDFLIQEKYTNTSRIAAIGARDGALAIANVVSQSPGLLRACILVDAPLDLANWERWGQSKVILNEYGSVKDSAEFKRILSLSPYHHIKASVKYPAILVQAPKLGIFSREHAMKYVARMQETNDKSNPCIYNHIEEGNRRRVSAMDLAFIWYVSFYNFIFRELDIK